MRESELPPRPVRWLLLGLANLFVALAMAGVALPGLPTVPFLLLAAWAASRSSPRLHHWLYNHPRYGPYLRQWRDQRAIGRPSKVLAVALLALSWGILWWQLAEPWLLAGLGALFVAIATYLVTRPEPVVPGGAGARDE
jgi:hypothetical protein